MRIPYIINMAVAKKKFRTNIGLGSPVEKGFVNQ